MLPSAAGDCQELIQFWGEFGAGGQRKVFKVDNLPIKTAPEVIGEKCDYKT